MNPWSETGVVQASRPYSRVYADAATGTAGRACRPALAHVLHFGRALRDAGVMINPSGLIDLCRCLELIDIGNRRDFHAAARTVLINQHEDLERFDRVFREFWEQAVPAEQREQRGDGGDGEESPQGGERESNAARQRKAAGADSRETDPETRPEQAEYSDRELLLNKDMGEMTELELQQARQIIAELVRQMANYRGRRLVPGKGGARLDFRRMFRRSAASGGQIARISHLHRKEKKTRLVVLCDVSGSMERYSNFLIQFIYALRRELPQVEIGVFSTRLSMITDVLDSRDIDASLQQVLARVRDWGSGTDIGGSLQEFNRHHARRVVRYKTLLIILSDGWDRGDARLMREQIGRLRSAVYKLIWLNPLLGRDNYMPLCRGIRTALPYMDHFLPAHNLASLKELSRTLKTAQR